MSQLPNLPMSQNIVTTHPVIARRRFVPTKQSPHYKFGDCFAKNARNDMMAE